MITENKLTFVEWCKLFPMQPVEIWCWNNIKAGVITENPHKYKYIN